MKSLGKLDVIIYVKGTQLNEKIKNKEKILILFMELKK